VFASIADRCHPELYFVDNGCLDDSLALIRQAHQLHPNIYVIVLSRNFGYQCALEAGMRIAEADLYVMIDVDCEDPPELIARFLAEQAKGYDIVYGERVDRPEGVILKGARKLFYRLVRTVADENFVLDMAEFSLVTAEVRNAIIQDSTSFPFLRASIGRIGFRRLNIPYARQPRVAGRTHYNIAGMTVFAIAGILSASTLALRLTAYLFPFWAALMGVIVVMAVTSPRVWHIPVLLLLGFLFVGFAVMSSGLYIARIYKDGLLRPNAIVRATRSLLPSSANLASTERAARL
jgi:glycosyltransferase involved in cell wall biosynthesis